jgi:sec-independent protein translocase protein TatA
MLNGLQPWHVIILVVVIIVVFGSRKLPDAARSLGKSMRIFKSEMRELQHEDKSEDPPTATPVQSERVDTAAPEQNHTDARPA